MKAGGEVISTTGPVNELEQTLIDSQDSLSSQVIRSIFEDSKGNLWLGAMGGIIRYDGKSLKYFSEPGVLRRISAHAIAEDKNGNLWFGTNVGAIKYDGKTFRVYDEKDGLTNTNIGRKSILVDKSGTMWVGTDEGVFQYIPSADRTGGKCFSSFHLLPPITVRDIMEDNTGNIWFATKENGVFRYDPVAVDAKRIINITGKQGLGDNYTGGMIQDNTGGFWFTMKGGICRYDGPLNGEVGQKTFTEITTKDGLGGSEVTGIAIEKSGIIWITARGSTTRYDPSIPISNSKAFTVFTEDEISCCIQSMYEDRSGNMWWGTGAGLYRYDGKRVYQVKQNGPWR
ncbi:MAG TPA: two-component regulator propeller domain-containing protein [Chryseosolibacter sp.]|nr:two-component regulator propeller domain-containing protein [Chryseosolibacter sp.]